MSSFVRYLITCPF